MSNFANLDDDGLNKVVKNLKVTILKFINLPDNKRLVAPNEKSCPPIAGAQLAWGLLLSAESEIRSRGQNPADTKFGRDIVGEFARIFGEL